MNDAFRADWLPSWEAYAQTHALDLLGGGNERRAVCAIHAGDRDSLAINLQSGAWCCHSCGAKGGDVLAFHRELHGLGFIEAAKDLGAWDEPNDAQRPQERARPAAVPAPAPVATAAPDDAWKRATAARTWRQSLPIRPDNSPAAKYLIDGRNCVLPPAGSDLRWMPDLSLFGFAGPALVGRMTLANDHRVGRGLHITWLQQDANGWRRAERRYLGPKAGCVVRLWPDEYVTHGLGVAEGIETGLSLAHAYAPVWACLDAGNLTALPVLAGIGSLLIAADHDEAGIKAAETCAARWAAAGCEVSIAMPDALKTDINDLARAA